MPLIIIKTLQQTTFTISVSETATVLEMKQEIMKENGSQVGSQKLIHSGKVLDDGKLVSEYGIKEKDFVVLMVTKAVVKPPAAVPVVQPTPIVQPTPVAQPTPTAQPTDTTTSLATGASYDSAVANLTEMGFEVEQIKAAMRAAFNNPDRAAEYLMTGIPDSVSQQLAAPAAPQAPQTLAAPTQNAAPPSQYVNLFDSAQNQARPAQPAGGMPANLAEIRNSPQFEQLRQVIQTNPQMLQPILQNLAQTNPALLETINQNPDAFLQMLLGGEGGEEVDVMGEGPQPGQVTVSITAEEEAAINRLAGLGFDRNMCLQAFFACDKNEEMAANFLFDSANDF